MATKDHIRNPLEWGADAVSGAARAIAGAHEDGLAPERAKSTDQPAVRKITVADVWDALAKGLQDLGAFRTDIVFLCVFYPVAGLVLARVATGYDMLPLVFPLASGFAIIGPVAAVGLYQISKRREEGLDANWKHMFGVVNAPGFGAIVRLSVLLAFIYALWLGAAYLIYAVTLGPEPPTSVGSFVTDVFTTGAGWAMIVIGVGVGFWFAVVALAIGVTSFPMLIDRNADMVVAMSTSVRAVTANPVPMAVWGVVVTGGLVAGSIPALIGLIVVIPVLGHATWHLYRKVVEH